MNPLHYKLIVTKRKIHVTYLSSVFIVSAEVTIAFVFFPENKHIEAEECVLTLVIQNIAYLLVSILNLCICIIILLVSYTIITVKLNQRSLKFSTGSDINSKFTKASWLTVTAFLILYFPAAVMTIITSFLAQPYSTLIKVLLDSTYLIYYFNNVINPFIYYFTLKDFKSGYKLLVQCKGTETEESSQETQLSCTN